MKTYKVKGKEYVIEIRWEIWDGKPQKGAAIYKKSGNGILNFVTFLPHVYTHKKATEYLKRD